MRTEPLSTLSGGHGGVTENQIASAIFQPRQKRMQRATMNGTTGDLFHRPSHACRGMTQRGHRRQHNDGVFLSMAAHKLRHAKKRRVTAGKNGDGAMAAEQGVIASKGCLPLFVRAVVMCHARPMTLRSHDDFRPAEIIVAALRQLLVAMKRHADDGNPRMSQ